MSAQVHMEDFNQIYDNYCDEGLYTNASNLLVDQAQKCLENGDTLNAYKLQLKNCYLTEDHLEDFFQKGLTWEGYFANWYMTISLEGWVNKKEDAARHFFSLLSKMKNKAPDLLPFYASTLSCYINDCKDPELCDSICLLQSALDYIKAQPITKELVKQYIDINECFLWNRFYNSYDGVILKKNRLPEIRNWYKRNSSYILNLDISVYHTEILQYELEYANHLYSFAGACGAQEKDPIKAISIYEEEINILESILKISEKPAKKIAACNAQISLCYYELGDMVRSKEYAEKSAEFLFTYDYDFDFEYCDVLSSLSMSFFYIGEHSIAAQMKLNEIMAREKLGWHWQQSDWALYFLFSKRDNPRNILKLKDVALSAETRGNSVSIYNYIGEAYSSLMNKKNGYKDSAEFYFNKVDSILEIDNEMEYYLDRKASIKESWARHYMRLNDIRKSYNLSKEALNIRTDSSSYTNSRSTTDIYFNVSLKSSLLHDIDGIHKYLPIYYYGLETDLNIMLPTLGSVESDTYLGNGTNSLYYIPEWASWNPTDNVSVYIAYDAALLMKGLTLKYNTLTPYISDNPSLIAAKQNLDRMRDSIYTISDDNQQMSALYKYEQAERELLIGINKKLVNIHWQDVKKHLKNDMACIEFVKYTTNAYSWSKGIPKPHYAAILMSGGDNFPIFVDLFDEEDLKEAYTLQPKSYDTETGLLLYDRIWGKLNKYISGKRQVYFSPMGMLNLINMEALVDTNGVSALENYNLIRLSSTKEIVSSKKEESISSVVSFGGIDYTQMSVEIVDSLNTRGNWNYLKNTLTEVHDLKKSLQKKNINVNVVIGNKATETSFKMLDGTTANVIHVASHGFYIPPPKRDAIPYYEKSDYTKKIKDELFYSGLIMSGGQTTWNTSTFEAEKDDGILTSYEISKLDLHNVELVVLSACETGIGDNLYDGIFGLQRAFKKAGVKTILMSLWSIDDKATSEYMGLFFDFLTSGLSKHESYKKTVVEMRKRYPDPYYWASFVMLD